MSDDDASKAPYIYVIVAAKNNRATGQVVREIRAFCTSKEIAHAKAEEALERLRNEEDERGEVMIKKVRMNTVMGRQEYEDNIHYMSDRLINEISSYS